MTFDPTTNRIQTMLLTPEERATLEAWPHGLEYFYCGRWNNTDSSGWASDTVYRGKPAPVMESVWFNGQKDWVSGPYKTRELADQCAGHLRVDVLRIDTCNGISTAHLEGLE